MHKARGSAVIREDHAPRRADLVPNGADFISSRLNPIRR
jgi:hypothetical protein